MARLLSAAALASAEWVVPFLPSRWITEPISLVVLRAALDHCLLARGTNSGHCLYIQTVVQGAQLSDILILQVVVLVCGTTALVASLRFLRRYLELRHERTLRAPSDPTQ